MTAPEYTAWRARLAALFLLRVGCAGAIVWVWDDLDSIQKVAAIALAAVVVPRLTSVRRLLVPYDRYVREGVPD
ncbi:MAG: hypothetical protein JSS40_06065 [Proteobacteria bacterium]|nr:hypothetical protein [Pseudomonadota bacterium]